MKPGRKLVLEAILVPLMLWVFMWMLFYIHPPHDISREDFNASWLVVTIVSYFMVMIVVLLLVRRLLRKAGYQFELRELFRVLDRADPKIIGDSIGDIFTIVILWGAFSTGVLALGLRKGIIFTVRFYLVFMVVVLLLMICVVVVVIDLPLILYEILTGKRLLDGFKGNLIISLISGGFLIFSSLIATNLGFSGIAIIYPLLKLYMNRDLYKNLLLLSALNALYGITGILILPRRRRLGLLMLLLIALALIPILIKVFIEL
ncbi:hypothetical protein [Thermococcus sp.]|uniref:hypothetical protein n=1 Tax=Thermococcus sp. TaxID=35749 RepID=UPI00262D2026|nr:hypothetical protein [Thermococcus sp.]